MNALDNCPLGPACEPVELIQHGFQFKGEEAITAMKSSRDYSPSFKLLLKQSENRALEDDNQSPSLSSGSRGQHQGLLSSRFRRVDQGDLDTMEEITGGWGDSASSSHMSTSVPISMPQNVRDFRNRNMSHHFDDEIEELSAEFDDIPKQMQALSESIQERDRYIFGDRPRQRVNTGDFTQVKWQ
ncbi:hypothetical protein RRG08_054159 [Elysia crispata]|uniref:Uncharacterized protein n=1 Tax=Elysia crispata TaxID=231223 RepID=A0AAE1A2I6_9GAST|nr:hypothetical protein RRG08_054159 [Elysia crispata]